MVISFMSYNIRIPDDLTNPKAREEYVRKMREFHADNERQPDGLCGSYCEGGQEASAYHFAMSFQKPLEMHECKSVEEAFERALFKG